MTGAEGQGTSQSSRNQRIEAIRADFEKAWTGAQSLQIEELLAVAPEAERGDLLRALVRTEILLRQRDGILWQKSEYQNRFPGFREEIDCLFHELGTSSTVFHSLSLSSTIEGGSASSVADDLFPNVGRYQIKSVLGRGSFGRVFLAHDDELGRNVAVKIPHKHLIATQADIDLYMAEARILASLDHPGIVPVYDVGRTDDGLCYVVSKFIEGESLAERMGKVRFPFEQSAELVGAISQALHYAHSKGLVHRDVKPANILLDQNDCPYVADFGLALQEADWTPAVQVVGTPSYMSPEQARGEGHMVDGRADIFSLCIIFYELLAGRRPFLGSNRSDLLAMIQKQEARPPRQVDDSIPPELERICLKGLQQRVSDRYSTALDLSRDLQDWLTECQTAPIEKRPAAPSNPKIDAPAPAPKIVPKGLRSFDLQDAEFFLELLPGPRDRYGIPDSIRFWKTAIEETDTDRTFRVGLLYGPSGCGKSSFMKAGLQPLLSAAVLSIPGFREPINSFTHLIAAIIFLGLAIVLLRRSQGHAGRKFALGIFGCSSVLLLSTSGIYHMLWPGNDRDLMERMDVAAIFILIAGTFTPAYAILYRGLVRFCLLSLIWGTAIFGIALRMMFYASLSGWAGTIVFLIFGWIGAISAVNLWKRYSFTFIRPLVWGGLAYTCGALLLEFHWPTLIPRVLGPHELWHFAVLIGLSFHWQFVWQFANGPPELVFYDGVPRASHSPPMALSKETASESLP